MLLYSGTVSWRFSSFCFSQAVHSLKWMMSGSWVSWKIVIPKHFSTGCEWDFLWWIKIFIFLSINFVAVKLLIQISKSGGVNDITNETTGLHPFPGNPPTTMIRDKRQFFMLYCLPHKVVFSYERTCFLVRFESFDKEQSFIGRRPHMLFCNSQPSTRITESQTGSDKSKQIPANYIEMEKSIDLFRWLPENALFNANAVYERAKKIAEGIISEKKRRDFTRCSLVRSYS